MKRPRKCACVAIALLVSFGLASTASAEDASFDDARDPSSALDIATVSHTNDDETATYRIDFYDEVDLDDVDGLAWEFDFDGDGRPAEACALMRKIGTTGVLRAGFYRDCGPEAWATSDARVDGRSIEFSLPLIDLVEGGGLHPGEAYTYRVVARDSHGVEDTAPDTELALHEDVPAPTARPGSAETELGFPGESNTEGAGNAARPAGAEDRLIPGEGEGPAPDEGRSAGVSFRFGPIPVCSGSSCFAMGLAAPIAIFAVLKLVSGLVRNRRKPVEGQTSDVDERVARSPDARSYPGHL